MKLHLKRDKLIPVYYVTGYLRKPVRRKAVRKPAYMKAGPCYIVTHLEQSK